MTPEQELFAAARRAMRLSRECERSSLEYDHAWHDYMRQESQRHRERAAWYLERRAMAKDQQELPL